MWYENSLAGTYLSDIHPGDQDGVDYSEAGIVFAQDYYNTYGVDLPSALVWNILKR